MLPTFSTKYGSLKKPLDVVEVSVDFVGTAVGLYAGAGPYAGAGLYVGVGADGAYVGMSPNRLLK